MNDELTLTLSIVSLSISVLSLVATIIMTAITIKTQNDASHRNIFLQMRQQLNDAVLRAQEKQLEYIKGKKDAKIEDASKIIWETAIENHLNLLEEVCAQYCAQGFMSKIEKKYIEKEYPYEINNLIQSSHESEVYKDLLTEECYPKIWEVYNDWVNRKIITPEDNKSSETK